MNIVDLLIRPVGGKWRIRSYVNFLDKILKKDKTLLDYGAGDCSVAEYIQESYGVKVTPIDVVDYNHTNLKLIIYDGKHLPYKDNSFDSVLVMFVLHHVVDQISVLREIIRVTKNKIIIFEDTPKNKMERFVWKFWDWILNLGHDVNMTYSARTVGDWEEVFKLLNLKIIEKKNLRVNFPILKMYQQTLFILEKNG